MIQDPRELNHPATASDRMGWNVTQVCP